MRVEVARGGKRVREGVRKATCRQVAPGIARVGSASAFDRLIVLAPAKVEREVLARARHLIEETRREDDVVPHGLRERAVLGADGAIDAEVGDHHVVADAKLRAAAGRLSGRQLTERAVLVGRGALRREGKEQGGDGEGGEEAAPDSPGSTPIRHSRRPARPSVSLMEAMPSRIRASFVA